MRQLPFKQAAGRRARTRSRRGCEGAGVRATPPIAGWLQLVCSCGALTTQSCIVEALALGGS